MNLQCFADILYVLQKSNDARTAVYKHLLGDHRKITDKFKSAEKELLFSKSECPSSRIFSLPRFKSCTDIIFACAGESKKQMEKVLKELQAVKGKFRIVFRIVMLVCVSDF